MSHAALVRRTIAGALVGSLAVSGSALLAGASPAGALEAFAFERLSGTDRYGTAAAIAAEAFPNGTSSAVVARGDEFADALAANYLAGVLGAPVLLTATKELPQVTADSLARLGVQDVFVVGGLAAVSAAVQEELDEDYSVRRLGSSDRYLTAQVIAQEAAGQAGSSGSGEGAATALLASGQDFPDALALAPLSYSHGFPLLLTRPGDLPGSTREILRDLGIERVVIAGQASAVSQAVEDEVEDLTGSSAVRLGGRTRFETATAIANYAYDVLGFDESHVVLARGDSPRGFADALTGSAVAGAQTAPIVLTNPTNLPTATETLLEQRSDSLVDGHLLGGLGAVSAAVEQAAETAARGVGGTAPSPSASPTSSASPSPSPSGTSAASPSTSASPSGGAAAARPASLVNAQAVDVAGDDGVIVTFDEPVQGSGSYAVNGGGNSFPYQVASGKGTSRLVLAPATAGGADFDATDGRTYTLGVTGERDGSGSSTTDSEPIDETGTRAHWTEGGQTRVLSVDSGRFFTTVQEAVNAEQLGGADTLRAFSAKGEAFREVVTISKDVTVEGAGDGDAVTPDDRTDLVGSFRIAADGVTVRGFDITRFGTPGAEPRPTAVQVAGGSTGFLIDDNTMTSGSSERSIGVITDSAENSGAITGNVIKGGDLGIYLQGTAVDPGFWVAGNTVTGTGNGSPGNAALASDAQGPVMFRVNVMDDNSGANLELFKAGATVSGNDFRDQDGIQISDVANKYEEATLVAANDFDRAVTAPAGVFSSLTAAVDSLSAEAQTVVVHPGDRSTYTGNALVDWARTVVRGAEETATTASVRVGGVIRVVADDVQVRSLRLSPSSTGTGEIAAVYLEEATRTSLTDNLFEGDGARIGLTERGVLNSTGGDTELATIRGNTFTGLTSGVFANSSADFVLLENRFESNFAGSSNDAASELTRNTFVGNVEAVGLGVVGPALLENKFANNDRHVCDYTAGSNPLSVFQNTNTYDGATTVQGTNPRCIVTTTTASGLVP